MVQTTDLIARLRAGTVTPEICEAAAVALEQSLVIESAADHLLRNYLQDELDEPDLCCGDDHWSAIHDLSKAMKGTTK